MNEPTVADCLDEIRRLRAQNERLTRLVKTRRPELDALREVATQIRDLAFNVPMKLESLTRSVAALLGGSNDDLPSLKELGGIWSDGRDRVYEALESPQSADAVDPHAGSTGTLSTREESS